MNTVVLRLKNESFVAKSDACRYNMAGNDITGKK